MKPITPREGRSWPGYILGGRLRTSTAALLIVFCAIWWLYETYEPDQHPEQVPASEVVPPGFIPDPSYTWVPRTDVQRRTSTPSSATPTSSTPTSATPAEGPGESPVSGAPAPPTVPEGAATPAPPANPGAGDQQPSETPGALAPSTQADEAVPSPAASAG